MNKLLKVFDHIFLMRPVLFIPGWATLLSGYAAVTQNNSIVAVFYHQNNEPVLWNPLLCMTLLAFACAMGGSFVLNQICDIHSDNENNKLFLIGNQYVSIRSGFVQAVLLIAVSLGVSFFINIYVFFTVLFFNILTAFFYNFYPFELKNRPLWGVGANMLMGWLAFASGWLLGNAKLIDLLVASLPFVFYNTGLYFLTLLPDIAGDRASKKITFAVRYGKQTTMRAGLLFFALTLLVSLIQQNQFMLLVGLLYLPLWIRLISHQTIVFAFKTCKVGITVFALSLCFFYPFFLIFLGIVFVSSRYYYSKRFNFKYPTLSGI